MNRLLPVLIQAEQTISMNEIVSPWISGEALTPDIPPEKPHKFHIKLNTSFVGQAVNRESTAYD